MRVIELTQGKVARVDDSDFEEQNRWKWRALKGRYTWYAVRDAGRRPLRKSIRMHRVLCQAPAGVAVDHRDGDGLNNQRHNLRPASDAQNGANRRKSVNNTSGYKGVTWYAPSGQWQVQIEVNQRGIHLGRFDELIDAALAYDAGARKHFGEFARLNFPDSTGL